MCDGCQQYFCVTHISEHRQELSEQMGGLTLEHDQLHRDLMEETTAHLSSLMARVDRENPTSGQ